MKQIGPNIFGPKFWKIVHNFELARWNLLKIVAFRVKGMRIEILKARGLGKFCSPRKGDPKIFGHELHSRVLFARSTFSLNFAIYEKNEPLSRARENDRAR